MTTVAAIRRRDQARAKAAGLYRGRQEDTKRNEGIATMLKAGSPWSQIQAATGCSRSTLTQIANQAKAAPMQGAGS